ncbi:hypothetical protein, partial [Proteus vulgaris]|uniref:hypothetical protein n=1 Tax=Proteus vulgaris TaxID=585 RepID=UPI0021A6A297
EVKRCSADGSVGSPHVRVGNCQALNKTRKPTHWVGFFAFVLLNRTNDEKIKCPRYRAFLFLLLMNN